MIGFIITGHAEFSKGLLSSLKMIAGEQEGVEAINFKENVNLDDFQAELTEKIREMREKYSGVMIFTDLLGGTPFRVSMLAASEFDQVEVLTGTNLPMLLEGTALRFTDDINQFSDQLVNSGKTGIENPQLELEEEAEDDLIEGGI